MTTKLPSLNALRVFAVAAQSSSFKQAAQQLGVSQAAVTRQIQTLEQQLGSRLFQRNHRTLTLSSVGQRLAPVITRLFSELELVIGEAKDWGDQQLVRLRVAMPELFLRYWLAPRLGDFQALYPHIQLQFSSISMFPSSAEQAYTLSQLQHESIDLAMLYGAVRDPLIRQTKLYQPCYQWVQAQPLNDTSNALCLVDQEALPWQLLQQQQPNWQVPSLRVGLNSSVDLLRHGNYYTLMDQLLLAGAELQPMQPAPSHPIQLPAAIYSTVKQRPRQAVALVAFQKWLETRLQAAP